MKCYKLNNFKRHAQFLEDFSTDFTIKKKRKQKGL